MPGVATGAYRQRRLVHHVATARTPRQQLETGTTQQPVRPAVDDVPTSEPKTHMNSRHQLDRLDRPPPPPVATYTSTGRYPRRPSENAHTKVASGVRRQGRLVHLGAAGTHQQRAPTRRTWPPKPPGSKPRPRRHRGSQRWLPCPTTATAHSTEKTASAPRQNDASCTAGDPRPLPTRTRRRPWR